jgi:phage terminase small subunit
MKRPDLAAIPSAPRHLQAATRRWFDAIASEFALESHHFRLLSLAGEHWDRNRQAGRALTKHGLTYTDRFGTPRPRPEVAIARDSSLAFTRIIRELGLPSDRTPESRLPAIANRYQGRKS